MIYLHLHRYLSFHTSIVHLFIYFYLFVCFIIFIFWLALRAVDKQILLLHRRPVHGLEEDVPVIFLPDKRCLIFLTATLTEVSSIGSLGCLRHFNRQQARDGARTSSPNPADIPAMIPAHSAEENERKTKRLSDKLKDITVLKTWYWVMGIHSFPTK